MKMQGFMEMLLDSSCIRLTLVSRRDFLNRTQETVKIILIYNYYYYYYEYSEKKICLITS
jgi:hypothetical protein